jgi:hypothetical protein
MKLGTILEKIFKFTGIAWVVEKLWGDDCGCDKRKEKLDNIKIFRRN